MASQSDKSASSSGKGEKECDNSRSVINPNPHKVPSPEAGPPPAYSPCNASFACVSIPETHRIRFLQFPDDAVRSIHAQLTNIWPAGLGARKLYNGAFEVRLNSSRLMLSLAGNCFARRFFRLLFKTLYEHGWLLDSNIRTSKKPEDKDTYLFRKRNDHPLPAPCDWFAISCDGHNILTIEDGPENFLEALRARLQQWTMNVSQQTTTTQITLRGGMWRAQGEVSSVQVRLIMLTIRETLDACSFGIYANLAMDGGDADVLLCNRVREG